MVEQDQHRPRRLPRGVDRLLRAVCIAATIQAVAVADDHWAFRPLQQPPVPTSPAAAQAQEPVDAFVVAKLAERGLRLSPAVEPAALVRRAYFDLTGLPPAPEEVDAFLADPSETAWSQLVDRLLASPEFGERWARHWLDQAGYVDVL